MTIGAFGIDNCAQEVNKTGVCHNIARADHAFTVINGDYGQFPAPDSSLTFVSIDIQLRAKYESILISPTRKCADKPCLHGGICHDVKPHGLYCMSLFKQESESSQSLSYERRRVTNFGGIRSIVISPWVP